MHIPNIIFLTLIIKCYITNVIIFYNLFIYSKLYNINESKFVVLCLRIPGTRILVF